MARGRRAQPDELKQLKGNPGKRRLALTGKDAERRLPPGDSAAGSVQVPSFLETDRARDLFKKTIEEYLQRRIARSADVYVYARWAYWMDRWIACAEGLKGNPGFYKSESPHGTYFREHPLAKRQHKVESELLKLEDRLGLNPAARQTIMRGLVALPPALAADLFGEVPAEAPSAEDAEKDLAAAAESPLGFLQMSGKPH